MLHSPAKVGSLLLFGGKNGIGPCIKTIGAYFISIKNIFAGSEVAYGMAGMPQHLFINIQRLHIAHSSGQAGFYFTCLGLANKYDQCRCQILLFIGYGSATTASRTGGATIAMLVEDDGSFDNHFSIIVRQVL